MRCGHTCASLPSVRLVLAALAALTGLLLAAPASSAASYSWQALTGDWSTALNWGGVEPTGSDTAYILQRRSGYDLLNRRSGQKSLSWHRGWRRFGQRDHRQPCDKL